MPALRWQPSTSGGAAAADASRELHESYRSRLAVHLLRHGRFDDVELSALLDVAIYREFRQGERLYAEGQTADALLFVLSGTVVLERYQVEITEGGQIGALDYFGHDALSAATAVVAAGDGVVAGFPFARAIAPIHARISACNL